jgi:hypothetical protein
MYFFIRKITDASLIAIAKSTLDYSILILMDARDLVVTSYVVHSSLYPSYELSSGPSIPPIRSDKYNAWLEELYLISTDNDKYDDYGDDDDDVVCTVHACSQSVTPPRISIYIYTYIVRTSDHFVYMIL